MHKSCPKCAAILDFSADACGCGHVFKKPRSNIFVEPPEDVAKRETEDSTKVRVNAGRLPAEYRLRVGFFARLISALAWPFRAIFGGTQVSNRQRQGALSTQLSDVREAAVARPSASARSAAPLAVPVAKPAHARVVAALPAPKSGSRDAPKQDRAESLPTQPTRPQAGVAREPARKESPQIVEPLRMGDRLDVGTKQMAAGPNAPKPNEPTRKPEQKKPEPAKAADPAAQRKSPSPEELAAQFAEAAKRGEWAVLPPGAERKEKAVAAPTPVPAGAEPAAGQPQPVAPAAPGAVKPSTVFDDKALKKPPAPEPRVAQAPTALGESIGPKGPPPTSSEAAGTITMTDDDEQSPAKVDLSKPAPQAKPPVASPVVKSTVAKPTPAPVPPAAPPPAAAPAPPLEIAMSNAPLEKAPGSQPPRSGVPNIRETMVFGALPIKPRVEQQSHFLDALDSDGQWGTIVEIGPQGVLVGRTQGHVTLPEVPSLGASHARFSFDDGSTMVIDLGARNGVMLKIQQPFKLKLNQRFRVGAHLLELRRFERSAPVSSAEVANQEEELCTREMTPHAMLVFVGHDGGRMFSVPLLKPETVIGRDLQADVPLIGDAASSRRHASIRFENGQHVLEDLGSQNGTFVQIAGQERLRPGDVVALGVLLFRVSDKETKR